MLDASVFALSLIGRGEFLIAEALIIGNVVDHLEAGIAASANGGCSKLTKAGARVCGSSVAEEDA